MKEGFSLLELIIAVAVGAVTTLVLVHLVSLCVKSVSGATTALTAQRDVVIALAVVQRALIDAPASIHEWIDLSAERIAWKDTAGALQGFYYDHMALYKIRGKRPIIVLKSLPACIFAVHTTEGKVRGIQITLQHHLFSQTLLVPVYKGCA